MAMGRAVGVQILCGVFGVPSLPTHYDHIWCPNHPITHDTKDYFSDGETTAVWTLVKSVRHTRGQGKVKKWDEITKSKYIKHL
jgi:hypothetical protein